jgi:hypothetical protein
MDSRMSFVLEPHVVRGWTGPIEKRKYGGNADGSR